MVEPVRDLLGEDGRVRAESGAEELREPIRLLDRPEESSATAKVARMATR